MIRYLETFYRHRLLLLAPVLLAVLFGVALVGVRQPMYESSAMIWLDGPAMDTGVPANSTLTLADQQAGVISELLSTHAFTAKVAQRGGLSDYLQQTNPQGGWLSRLRSIVGGGSGWSVSVSGSDQNGIGDAAYTVLNRNLKVAADGPQIVALSFDAPSAGVAQSTLRAVIDQFSDETLDVRRAQSQTVVDFFQQQVTDQAATLSAADARVAAYAAQHPKAGSTDLTLVALQRSDDLARQRYEGLLSELDQAKLDQAALNQAGGTGLRLIDPPNLPAARVGSTSTLVHAGIAGLAAGLLIMLFCLLALTAADNSLHRPEDVRSALGFRLVGTIPRLRQARP
jgi:uncharacterized protein involved in exopolysaccharide biosynthesis